MKRFPVPLAPAAFTGWSLLVGGLPIFALAPVLEPGGIPPLSAAATFGFVYNLLVSFLFCYWAWMKIASMLPVGVSSLSTLMVPVIGVFSGMAILGERPHWQDYAALVLVMAAVASVLLPGPRSANAAVR